MTSPMRLQPEDLDTFEQVLHQALNTAEVRTALHDAGRDAGRLRARALGSADDITAVCDTEYRAYRQAREADRLANPGPGHQPKPSAGLLPMLAVLAPIVAFVASVVLLLLGYALELTGNGSNVAALSLAGWAAAGVAAVTALLAGAGLFITALRHHRAPTTAATAGRDLHEADEVDRTRQAWRKSLLERGLLPFLHHALRETAPVHRDSHTNSTNEVRSA
ncbi:hypothetical protein J1792_18365 [Streptomyces triculaminicus]|uniref:Transmembrane protein n=2 Tax=Streptomyces TaxID=1883 RepID=A0A939JRC9_9ACTN|nr:hypothetical protein [Streptomyces triculaminicus]MBO0654672.1 hypothetical protein [Streptomyces triculaminicus]